MKETLKSGLIVMSMIQILSALHMNKFWAKHQTPVSEDSEEEEEGGDKTQQRMNHDVALAHADGLIKYLKEQDDLSFCNKMLVKKLQLQIKKKCFSIIQKNKNALLISLLKKQNKM